MVENPAEGGSPTPQEKITEGAAIPSEPNESDDIEFTPAQKKKLGKLLSDERKAVRAKYQDYDDLKQKISEIENAKLSEAERLQKERDEAKTEAMTIKKQLEEFTIKELRTQLYAEFKTKDGQSLPIGLMKYVTGGDEKTIAASIESIAADFGAKLEKRKSIGSPTPAGGEAPPGKNDFINAQILSMAGRGGR